MCYAFFMKRILGLWGFIFVLWSLYRLFFKLPEWFDEFVAKPWVWLIPTFFMVLNIEKKPLSTIGYSFKNLFKNIQIGWILGFLFAFEGVATNFIKYGKISFLSSGGGVDWIALSLFISLATAFSEETVARGFVMNRLWWKWGSETRANITSSILFGLLHIPISIFVLHYGFYDLSTYFLITTVFGFADGFVFARTGTIVAPVIAHSLWNLSVVLFR